jgi:hypothetical protein
MGEIYEYRHATAKKHQASDRRAVQDNLGDLGNSMQTWPTINTSAHNMPRLTPFGATRLQPLRSALDLASVWRD